jgi:ATP-dependent metalloprotease FtsH
LAAVLAILGLLAAYGGVLELSRPHVSGDQLRLDSFMALAEDGRIRRAEILDYDSYVVGQYVASGGSVRPYSAAYLKASDSRAQLAAALLDNRVPTTVNQQNAKTLVGPVTILLPALMLVVVMIYLILSYRRGTGLFGSGSGARRITAEQSSASFVDVAGQEQAVTELREIADFLSDPERFAAVGVQVPKGILLYGPPGCGKTLMARALAGEAGATFYSISGADFVELYVGVGAARVRELFREARENAPAIVFIDEIDSVGRRRAAGSGPVATNTGDEQEQALNGILAEMDGFSPLEGVIVVGATNRPDILDPALLRPGRFDRNVGLQAPDERGRLEILAIHARGKPLAEDTDLAAIAHGALGMTGADLANVVNEAGLLAARAGRREIAQADLDAALTRILEAPERQRRLAVRDRTLGQRPLTEEQVTFADVAGLDDALAELAEVRDYLGDPERYTSMGARIPSGFLLSGPPGCGKTLLARAVAREANAAFFAMAATEFVELYVGVGAARVRDLFAQARGVAPAIVFLDEIDAIGSSRLVDASGGSRETDQTLNQLLAELDGFGKRPGVIMLAATNRPEMLDPALVRPGRFDRQIDLELPDRDGRRAILALHANGKPLAADVDLDRVATLTRGLAGADLANVMNEAALLAARGRNSTIDMELVEEGIARAVSGVGASRIVSDEERSVTAYHEAGHGVVARTLSTDAIVHKLSIVPRGRRLGVAWLTEANERLLHSRSQLMTRLATLFGGRAAEEIAFGESTSGAAQDLWCATALARQMVSEWGMSNAVGGLVSPPNGTVDGGPLSEETARLIDSEVRSLLNEADELAHDVLNRSRAALDRVAAALIERETLTLEDVDEIAGPSADSNGRAASGRPAPAVNPVGAPREPQVSTQ